MKRGREEENQREEKMEKNFITRASLGNMGFQKLHSNPLHTCEICKKFVHITGFYFTDTRSGSIKINYVCNSCYNIDLKSCENCNILLLPSKNIGNFCEECKAMQNKYYF